MKRQLLFKALHLKEDGSRQY